MGVERNVMRCAVSGALAVVSAWATASGTSGARSASTPSGWRSPRAPRDVLTSLVREKDGSLAIHFLNAAGGASDTFPPLKDDLVFTLPEGDLAEVTSPDFAGLRTLTAERLADGRRRFTIPCDWLKAYLFVRVAAKAKELGE